MSERSAFIIGGTGQIGTATAERLLRDGWRVTTAHRGERSAAGVAGATSVILDRDDTDALRSAAAGHDVVVDTVAYRPEHADQLIELAPEVGSLVVISTGSVAAPLTGTWLEASTGLDDAPRYPDPLDEDVAILDSTTDAYSPNKAEVERRLRATELPISILRPGAIHGPASPMLREWYFIKRVLDGRPFAILAYDGESLFSTTDTRNIAELIALCADNPGARLLNAVDEELLTVAEIGRTVFDLMGHDSPIRTISGPPRADGVGDSPWALAHPLRMPMDRARRELGYRQAVSYRDGMTDAIEWSVSALRAAEARGGDWRDAFPIMVSRYGAGEWFPYDAEDAVPG